MVSSLKKGPFHYELEKYSRQYSSNTLNKSPQWTHILQPSMVILENMFPAGVISGGAEEPVLKVVSDQNVLLESLNVSYRYADSLKAKALLRSPTIGIRYNYTVLGNNGMPSSQETRKIQLRFKNIGDFESCVNIIGRYINCKWINSPTLNSNIDLGINSQTQENSQFRTNTTTCNNNMDLNRARREPSVIPMTRAGYQQQRINEQTAPSPLSYTSTSSNITQNPIIHIDGNHSTLQNYSKLQNSQSSFDNNNRQQFACPQQNNHVQIKRGSSDSQSMNNIGLHQSSIQDRSQQVGLQSNASIRSNYIISQNNQSNTQNTSNDQPVTLHSSSDTGNVRSQEPIIYTNNQDINVNPTAQIIKTKNERDELSYPSNGYIPKIRHMSVPPQVSTHETHLITEVQSREKFSCQPKQQAYFQQNQYNQKQCPPQQLRMNTNESSVQQNQNLQATQKINILNSQGVFNGHEHIGMNRTNIIRNNWDVSIKSGNAKNNMIMLSSNTSDPIETNVTSNQFQSSHIQQRQPVFPNDQNMVSNRVVSVPQTQQKIISQNNTNLHLPCIPTQTTFNSIYLPPVQQIKIKQEKMDIPPMIRVKEPYFIDLTIDDDVEFDFKPTQVSISHMQAQQPNLINRSQFARSIVPQVHLQSVNPDQSIDASTSLSQSAQNTSSSIIPQNTCLIHSGLQNLRNRPLSTIKLTNDNPPHLSESSIQRQNISLPEDDAELQDWIVNILKDPSFPQFVSRVEKLWKARFLAYDL